MVAVPLDMVSVERYQRNDTIDFNKLDKLRKNFIKNLCEPLMVVPHPETYNFSLPNGYHRVDVLKGMGYKEYCATILEGLSDDPNERFKQEAYLFGIQTDYVDRLNPNQKHNAMCYAGVERDVILKELADKWGFITTIKRTKNYTNAIQSITSALEIIGSPKTGKLHKNGERLMDDVLRVVVGAGWRHSPDATSDKIMKAISTNISNNLDREEEVIETLIEYLRKYEPKKIIDMSTQRYVSRSVSQRVTLFLEDYLHEKLDINYKYTAKKYDDVKEVRQKIKVNLGMKKSA